MGELVVGAFLSSFINVTLASFSSRDFGSLKGMMKKLEIKLNSFNQVLDEAEQKQYLSISLKKWLDDLKHNIYEVDQLLDEIATPARRKGKARPFSVFANNQFESRIRELLKELALLEMRKPLLELKEGTYANDNLYSINPALRLSYDNLPSNLKRCFAYCSIFPKGYEFDKDQLINCWMAEGLLKCGGAHKSEEELGNEFFDNLESISFFQHSNDGRGKRLFLMRDFVNDLAKSLSGEFCLRIEDDKVNGIPKRTRHIQYLLESKDGDKIFEHIYKIKGLRSLMVQQARYFQMSKNVQRDLYQKLRYLRMLSFRGCYLSKLGDEIGNLKLLRYLDLSSNAITSLPNSICKLYNLQTLLLQDCGLTELPDE